MIFSKGKTPLSKWLNRTIDFHVTAHGAVMADVEGFNRALKIQDLANCGLVRLGEHRRLTVNWELAASIKHDTDSVNKMAEIKKLVDETNERYKAKRYGVLQRFLSQ